MRKKLLFFGFAFFLVFTSIATGVYFYLLKQDTVAKSYPIKAIIQSSSSKEKLKTEIFIDLLDINIQGNSDLAKFDIEEAKKKIHKFPLISRVKVSKVYPEALHIEYDLRIPIFIVNDFQNRAIDKEGFLFPIEPYLTPKKLTELVLGLEDAIWDTSVEDRRFVLAKELLFLLNESTDLDVKRIDVSKAYITDYGKREILLSVEDRLFNGHKIFYFPFVLRLSPNHFGKQLANFLTLRKAMLEDYKKQLKAAKVSHRFKERVIDLRIENLALIENE